MKQLTVVQADPANQDHGQAIVELVQLYARDPMGLGQPLPADFRDRLLRGLQDCPTSLAFLAFHQHQPIALAICFIGFSTFAAQPLLNIHDLIVHPDFRRTGAATRLLDCVETHARKNGCCKVTLEVRCDNTPAQRLYQQCGFGAGDPPYAFWTKSLS